MFFNKKNKCLIIFGSGKSEEGYYPDGKNGQLRAIAGIYKLLEDENIKFVILSGGIPKMTKKGVFTEARALEYFIFEKLKEKYSIKIRQRISFGGRIYEEITFPTKRKIYFFKEVRSVDTRENIIYSKEILTDIRKTFNKNILEVLLLSNLFHLKRIEILAKQNKLKNYKLVSMEEILEIISTKTEENFILMTLTRIGFGSLITYIAKRQREN